MTVHGELFEATIGWYVTGIEPMHGASNPNGPMFVPAYVKVLIFEGGPPSIIVGGPELNRQGKQLKRNQITSFDHESLADGDAPAWLVELIDSVPWVRQLLDQGDRRELNA